MTALPWLRTKAVIYRTLSAETCERCRRPLLVPEHISLTPARMEGEERGVEIVECSCAYCQTVNRLVFRVAPEVRDR